MEEIINTEEIQYSTKFAVLNTIEDYQLLNNKIGIAKSYPDNKSDTYFYAEQNPNSINGKYYMGITTEIQNLFPELLTDLVLIDQIPYEDEEITDTI